MDPLMKLKRVAGVEATYGISIEKEADTGYKNHDPLIFLTINRLVDLLHAYMAVLFLMAINIRLCTLFFPRVESGRAYSFVIEIAGSVGLIQPMHHTAHDGRLWYFSSDLVSCSKINLKVCLVSTQEITWAIREIILCVWQEVSKKRNRGPVAEVGELKII